MGDLKGLLPGPESRGLSLLASSLLFSGVLLLFGGAWPHALAWPLAPAWSLAPEPPTEELELPTAALQDLLGGFGRLRERDPRSAVPTRYQAAEVTAWTNR
jgi:hypothetical protein